MHKGILISIVISILTNCALGQINTSVNLEQNKLTLTTAGCEQIEPQLYVNDVEKETNFWILHSGTKKTYLYSKFHIRVQHYDLHQIKWVDKKTGNIIVKFQYIKNKVGNNQYYGFKNITNITTYNNL